MKKTKILIVSFLMLGIGFLISSCEPESNSLGRQLDKSEIDFEIIQDFTVDPGGNTVIMTNKTPGVVLTWDYGTGRSNKKIETVKYAFKGEYTIKVSAVTAGGVVELDPVTITVTDDNLNYVNDPLWTYLTGGVGEEKTWVLDLNAEGVSKYFGGPMYFWGTGDGWVSYHLLESGISRDDVNAQLGLDSSTGWNWNPDWKGNEWMFPNGAEDFGTMTFSLKGGPYVTVDNLSTGIKEEGTYFLDQNGHTLTFTDATMLHDSGNNSAADFTKVVVFSLTENTMQLGVIRINDPAMLVYNFISKEYSDNWVPQDLPDPDPAIDLNGGTIDDLLSVTTTTSKTWVMSPDTPFNWTDLNGGFLNNWNSVTDYENSGWAPFSSADQSSVIKNKITFNNDGTVSTIDSNGVEASGSYSTSTDGTNIITFTGINPSFPIGTGWASVSTTSQNQWKIVKTKVTGASVTDIWFGKRDESGKNEYMVYHFVLQNPNADDPIEVARKFIIKSLTGASGTRTFKVSDSWHVDWLAGDLTGGWTGPTTFANDFTSNTWIWTAAVKAGLQSPTLTFSTDGTTVTATKVQDGVTTSAEVIIDPENNTIDIDMDLIAFKDAANWLPTYGPTWYICKVPLSTIETNGLWLGKMGVNGSGDPEVTAIHYVISN